MREGLSVWLTPPPLTGPHERTVLSVRGGETPLVAISGIESMADAEGVVGDLVLVRRADVPEAVRTSLERRAEGRAVVDQEQGELGRISEVMNLPANDVWVVSGGPFGEVLVPVIDDVIVDLPEEGPITVRLLPGLIDPNRVQDEGPKA